MIILAALALAAASPAAPPRPATPAQAAQALARMGFSPAGVAILLHPPAPKVDQAAMMRRNQQLNAALISAVQAAPFDPARFEQALRGREAFRSQVENIRLGQVMQIVRTLPPADRPLFARGLVTPPPAPQPR